VTVQRLVGAAALVQVMRRDGFGPTPHDATGGPEPIRLRDHDGGFAVDTSNPAPDPAMPDRALYAAAE